MAMTRTERALARPHGHTPTITAPPTARPLLKRGSYDNTCGYSDGDPGQSPGSGTLNPDLLADC